MKKFREWLVDTHPDLLDRGKCFLQGQEVGFGTINNQRLHRAVREHHAAGQEAMADFIKWLIRHEGLRETAAKTNAAEVWNALCITWNAQEGLSHPEALFESPAYSKATLDRLQGFLRRWARYSKDPFLSSTIEGIRGQVKKGQVVTSAESMRIEPYTIGEIDAVLEATEKLRGDPRWPWGWPVIRMIILGGARISELQIVTRSAVAQALSSGSIFLWTPNRGTRALPVDLIREELEALLAWPWSWGGIADIIAPHSASKESATGRLIWKLGKHVFEMAGVECHPRLWTHMCRWAAALRYYEITGCLVGATHLLGSRYPMLVEAKLKVLGERQKERDKRIHKKRRQKRSVVADEAEAGGGGDQGQEAVEGGGLGDEALEAEAAHAVPPRGP